MFLFKRIILFKKSNLFLSLSVNVAFLTLTNLFFAQENTRKNFGVKLGVIANFGSHVNQIGLRLDTYVNHGFVQVNLGNSSTFSFANLAQRKKLFENRFSVGVLFLGGKQNMEMDFIWDGLRHQTNYQNAVGYNYLWYRDNLGSSQNSGGWTGQVSNFQLFFENDIFAGTGKDKFRTGHLMLGYRHRDFNFQLGTKLWTGETRGSDWQKIQLNKCPSGYRILEDLPYGKTSHGIIYGGISYHLPHGNYLNGQIGMDSEQVRHIFQNRLSHDMILFPKQIERKTPHYPRLDENGCPVFEKESIRNNKLYLQFGINSIWSY